MNQNNFQPNNNYKIPQKPKTSNITRIKQFTYVPMIGIKNIGQTCYMK